MSRFSDYQIPAPTAIGYYSSSIRNDFSYSSRFLPDYYVNHTITRNELTINFDNNSFVIKLKDLKQIFNDVMVKELL